jgi:hypothetical protein
MFQIKRAAKLMMPLALLCSIAMAQQPGSAAKSTTRAQLKVQTQAPPVEMQLAQQVSGPNASDVGPAQKTPTIRGTGTDALPTACPTPVYAVPPGDVYGRYVPYIPPPSACPTLTSPAASSSASPANSSTVHKIRIAQSGPARHSHPRPRSRAINRRRLPRRRRLRSPGSHSARCNDRPRP